MLDFIIENYENKVYLKNFIKHNIENKDVFGIYLNNDLVLEPNSFIEFNCGIKIRVSDTHSWMNTTSIFIKGTFFDLNNPNILILGNCFRINEEICLFLCNRTNLTQIIKKDTCIAKGYYVVSSLILAEAIDDTQKTKVFYDYENIQILKKEDNIKDIELITDLNNCNKKIIIYLKDK